MAANMATMQRDGHDGFFGRSFVRLAIAALMAVLVLGAISNAASARPATTTMGQNDFVSQCRAGGGTPKRLGTHVVQCTTGGGEVVTCDFNTSPATCIIASRVGPRGQIGSVITDGVLVEAEPASGGSGVRPGQVGNVSGGVFEQVEAVPAASDQTVTTGGTFQVIDTVAVEDPAPSPAPSPAPESQAAPLPGGVVAAEPVVVESVEDEQQ